MPDPTEVVIVPAAAPASPDPLSMLDMAIRQGMDVEKLGRLMDLHERNQANQAAIAFGNAVQKFQSLCPIIRRKKVATIQGREGKQGYTYNFASYDDIHKAIRPLLAECGLTVTFETAAKTPGLLDIICRVRHGIHVEVTPVSLPIPQLNISQTQQFGAAVSYGKRYAIQAALNIVVSNEDDDAQSLIEKITEAQAVELEKLIAEKRVNMDRFMGWVHEQQPNAENLRDLAGALYPKAKDMLVRRKADGTNGTTAPAGAKKK